MPLRQTFRSLVALLLACFVGGCAEDSPSGLRALEVTPNLPAIAAGTSQGFTAMGVFHGGGVADLSGLVDWTSSDETVVAMAGSMATSFVPGSAVISATDPVTGLRGETTLTVTAAVLDSLALSPPLPQVALGTSQQLTAMGTFSDATTQNLTSSVVWSTSDNALASVAGGLASGEGVGTATVTATDVASGVDASVPFVVTPAVLTSLDVTPAAASIALGTTETFTATGTYSDSTTQDLTSVVTWSSSDELVATVSGATGLAESLSVGATTIGALDPDTSITGSITLTVTAAELVSIEVSPGTPSIALGTTQAFTATGTYTDGSLQDLTSSVTWSSSARSVAVVDNAPGVAGLATSFAVGTTTVGATHAGSGIVGSTTLEVTAAELVSLALSPQTPSIPLGTTQAFTATGTYTDASLQDLTDAVTWSSSAPGVASVDNAPGSEGLATSLAVGTTTVTATDPVTRIANSTLLSVSAAELESLSVTPATPSIALGTGQAFVATGTYTDATMLDLTESVTWSSSAPAVATVSNAPGDEGLATSLAVGATSVTATHAATTLFDTTTLTVTAAELVSLDVDAATTSLVVGATEPLAATGTYTDATTQPLTDQVVWSSSSPSVATVSNAPGTEGVVTAVGAGSTTITATHVASGLASAEAVTVLADIAYLGAASASAPSATSLEVATPVGVLPGDVLVAAVAVRPSGGTITAPSEWTLVRRLDNASGNTSALATYTRVVTASEPASHTWSFSASTGSVAAIAAFEGPDALAPIDVEAGQSTASALSHATPSVTTTLARTMVVTAHAFTSSSAWTPPAGFGVAAEVASLPPENGGGISLVLSYAAQPLAGPTGSLTASASANADTGNAQVLALAP